MTARALLLILLLFDSQSVKAEEFLQQGYTDNPSYLGGLPELDISDFQRPYILGGVSGPTGRPGILVPRGAFGDDDEHLGLPHDLDPFMRKVPPSQIDEEKKLLKEEHPDLDIPPDERTTEEKNSCELAINNLDTRKAECGNRCFTRISADNPEILDLERKFIDAAQRYDQYCLSSPIKTQRDNIHFGQGLPGALASAQANKLVGVLTESNEDNGMGSAFCGALLLDKGRFITARHCFYNEFNLRNSYGYKLQSGAIGIHQASDPSSAWVVKPDPVQVLDESDISPGEFLSIEYDFVVLQIEGEFPDLPEYEFASPTSGEPLWVLGHYAYFDHERLDMNGQKVDPYWYAGMRWSRGSSCLVTRTQDSCVAHTCQTEGGYSGTPLVSMNTESGGPLKISGIQIASIGEESDCNALDSRSKLNAGLIAERIKQITEQL